MLIYGDGCLIAEPNYTEVGLPSLVVNGLIADKQARFNWQLGLLVCLIGSL